jgi:hypothetical protein
MKINCNVKAKRDNARIVVKYAGQRLAMQEHEVLGVLVAVLQLQLQRVGGLLLLRDLLRWQDHSMMVVYAVDPM